MSENNNNTNEAMDSSEHAAASVSQWKLSIKTPKDKKDISIETSATVQQVGIEHSFTRGTIVSLSSS
jgi:hypothetical protein